MGKSLAFQLNGTVITSDQPIADLPGSDLPKSATFVVHRIKPSAETKEQIQLVISCDDGVQNQLGEILVVPQSALYVAISGNYEGTQGHGWVVHPTDTSHPVSNVVDFSG